MVPGNHAQTRGPKGAHVMVCISQGLLLGVIASSCFEKAGSMSTSSVTPHSFCSSYHKASLTAYLL